MRFADFTDFELNANGAAIRGRKGGDGPPLLLLHGSAHSPRLWESVAGQLAERHLVVVPAPASASAASSRTTGHREQAAAHLAMMEALGFPQFMVCGHEEGARVAQRLALDHGSRIERMMVLDTGPTLPAATEPLASADVVGGDADVAGAGPDDILIRVNLERGDKIACPVRVLWGGHGTWASPPLDGWRQIARDTSGREFECAPCIPEHAPDALLDEMSRFFDTRAC